MEHEIRSQLVHLAFSAIVAWIVWKSYENGKHSNTERYATFWPRFWTGSVDSLVLWPMGFATTVVLSSDVPRGLAALMLFADFLVSVLYAVLMHGRYGQTVGKMVTKVQVVDFRTEGAISYRQALLRDGLPAVLGLGLLAYIMFAVLTGTLAPRDAANDGGLADSTPFWVLAALPLLWFLAEVLTMLTNKKRRALHDFIAGTVVVRTNVPSQVWAPVGGMIEVGTDANEGAL